jgi:hypothetical protein
MAAPDQFIQERFCEAAGMLADALAQATAPPNVMPKCGRARTAPG